MAWCGDVRFKQRAVIEFLVAEKESVINIHRQLKNAYGDNAVDKSTVSCWASQIVGSGKGQASSVMCLTLAGQHQQSFQRCCNVLMN
jgi:hypothetical protein